MLRAEYDPENDLLEEEFILRGKWFQRKDIEVRSNVFSVNVFLSSAAIL